MKKILAVLLVVTLVLSATSIVLATMNRNDDDVAESIGTYTTPIFSAIPDDYCEYGYPIFYITVSPDEWAEIFRSHPFYQGQTPYENAAFIFIDTNTSDIGSRSTWCSNCSDRTVIEMRWTNPRFHLPNCPTFTVVNSASPRGADHLYGWTWETRDVCHTCGWASHLWSHWWRIDFNNLHLWFWEIVCSNMWSGREEQRSMRITTVVAGASIRRGHSAHQSISFRLPLGNRDNPLGIVHGHNCQVECGRLC